MGREDAYRFLKRQSGGLVFPSQNFPQFIVIYTVKGFGIDNKAEIDVFLELSCFFDDPVRQGSQVSMRVAPALPPHILPLSRPCAVSRLDGRESTHSALSRKKASSRPQGGQGLCSHRKVTGFKDVPGSLGGAGPLDH